MTVRFVPARPDGVADKPPGEQSAEYVAFEQAGPGDVIVMEAMRTTLMSVGGDIKFLRLKQRGVDGLICDGGIRDMNTVKDYGISLWGLGRTAALGTQVGFPYTANDAISVDGVLVRPGDYLVADDDGVVVIPRGIAPEIARQTIERDDLEEWIRPPPGRGEPLARQVLPARRGDLRPVSRVEGPAGLKASSVAAVLFDHENVLLATKTDDHAFAALQNEGRGLPDVRDLEKRAPVLTSVKP